MSTNVQSSDTNFLEMSDADFLKLPEPELVDAPTDSEITPEVIEPEPVTEPTDEPTEPTEVVEPTEPVQPTEPKESEIDYKAFYERITGGFTANGATVKVNDANEVVSLMQKGCGFTRKMQELVPVRAATELLKEHDLLDPVKLGFLIEVSKGNPTAIAKLVKDHNIDVYSQEDNLASYKPTPANPNELAIVVRDTFESLSNSEHYGKLCNTITSLDEGSKQLLANQPNMINQLHNQMATGIYDTVYSAMAVERAKGNFVGMSDLEAYMEMGTLMMNQGNLPQTVTAPSKPKITTPVKKPSTDPSVIEQRRNAAAPTGSGKGKVTATVPNYLGMSDEEFAKLAPPSV